jgi:transcriptional regulator with XRE-family HTH domain
MNVSDRLKCVRESLKMTLAEAKTQTGIGESSLSDFENGKREPSLTQLHTLANAYKRTLSFFLEESAIASEAILSRKRPQEGAEKIEASFRQLCERYQKKKDQEKKTINNRPPIRTWRFGRTMCAMPACPNRRFLLKSSDIEKPARWPKASEIFSS